MGAAEWPTKKGVVLLFAREVKFTSGAWRGSAEEREEKEGETEGEAGRGRKDGGERRELLRNWFIL